MSVVGPRYGATCLRPENVRWNEALEPDERDPRILGEGPCHHLHEARAKYEQNQFGAWLLCRTCAVRLHYAPKKGASQKEISLGRTPEVVRAVIAELGNTPVDQIDSNRFRGMIKIEQGRRQTDRATAKLKAASETVLKAKLGAAATDFCKPTAKARPTSAPRYHDLSSEASPKEDPDSPTLDGWNILLRRLLRQTAEIEAMMDL